MAIPGMTDQEMSVLNLKRFQLLLLRSRISFSSARSLIQSEINVIGISSGYMMKHFLSPYRRWWKKMFGVHSDWLEMVKDYIEHLNFQGMNNNKRLWSINIVIQHFYLSNTRESVSFHFKMRGRGPHSSLGNCYCINFYSQSINYRHRARRLTK